MASFASVSGLSGVLGSLTASVTVFGTAADAITAISAQNIYSVADANVPVDTGQLQASGVVRQFSEGAVKGYEVAYGGGIPAKGKTYSYPQAEVTNQSGFVELGTRFMAPRPFLFPSFEQEKPNWQSALNNL